MLLFFKQKSRSPGDKTPPSRSCSPDLPQGGHPQNTLRFYTIASN